MPLPRRVARFNKRATNRFMEPLARRFENFAVVHHRGRVSGAAYATPVNYFRVIDRSDSAERVIVALTYGPRADWVRNVGHGPAELERHGRRTPIVAVVGIDREAAWPCLPPLVRLALRVLRVRHFLELSLGDRLTSL